jgi:hypothetical protein
LHVLSAPPAFVLSQDQTLREDLVSPRLPKKPADDLVDELEAQSHPSPKARGR